MQKIFSGFIIIFFIIVPLGAGAVSLNKSSFKKGEPIIVTEKKFETSNYTLYDLTTETLLGGAQSIGLNLVSVSWNEVFPLENKEYVLIEVASDIPLCEEIPDTYSQCRLRPEAVHEIRFQIAAGGSGRVVASSNIVNPLFVAPLASAQVVSETETEIETLKAKIAFLQAQIENLKKSTELSPVAVIHEEGARFTQWMRRGSYGKEVEDLQVFFARDKAIYPEGDVTGYFGPLTEKAVQRFQITYGIVSSGDPDATGFGFVGPKTLKKLNEIIAPERR